MIAAALGLALVVCVLAWAWEHGARIGAERFNVELKTVNERLLGNLDRLRDEARTQRARGERGRFLPRGTP